MCQPDFSLKNDSSKILNVSNENITAPLPFFVEETANEVDEQADDATSAYEETLPIVSVIQFNTDIETLESESNLRYSFGSTSLQINNHRSQHRNSRRNRRRRGRRGGRKHRRGRGKRRQQIHHNLRSINKFVRKAFRTLQHMKSLMMQQNELVQNMRSYGYAAE